MTTKHVFFATLDQAKKAKKPTPVDSKKIF